QRKINLYSQRLIPKSIESLRATEAAYISEKLDFLNLVDAQRRYLQFLLESERSLVQYQKAYARLEYLAGREL
ncbi:MAG: TolC family protein, partial [Candidatus Marinimicrobia bacterium]|nr:TolC family protein [Candidatus Neomarinimicrobiota bacterium]